MSARPLISIAIVFVLCSVVGLAGTQVKAESRQEQALVQLEKKWLAAIDDPGVLQSILADDFIHVLPSGFVTKEEHINYVRNHPTPKSVSRHFEDLRVRIYGTAGVANGIVVATDAQGKTRRTAFTDVFAYRDGKWRAVNAQELPLTSENRQGNSNSPQ